MSMPLIGGSKIVPPLTPTRMVHKSLAPVSVQLDTAWSRALMQRVSPAGTTTVAEAPGRFTKLVDWVVNWLVSVFTTLLSVAPQECEVGAAVAGREAAARKAQLTAAGRRSA